MTTAPPPAAIRTGLPLPSAEHAGGPRSPDAFTASRIVLVFGATGKQGGATVAQLCELPRSRQELKILAVTRNPDSDAAVALKRKFPQVDLFQGDYDNLGALFDGLPGTPEAIFSVYAAAGRTYAPQREIAVGQKLHEAAIDIGVKHIVYSSVDRHGAQSDTTSTKVPYFDSKWEIEQHLVAECARASSRTTWTILRPVTFFDNLTPDLPGRLAAATVGRCRRAQQMVAVRDIGWFAARALTGYAPLAASSAAASKAEEKGEAKRDDEKEGQAEKERMPENAYAYRKISLAGDELDLPALRERFYEKMGYALPEAYAWMGGGALWMSKDLTAMYAWLGKVGYGADIDACRREHPGMLRFAQWVEKESKFTRGAEVLGNWLS